MNYGESYSGQIRRNSKKREIEEAFDEELESFIDIDFYDDESVEELKNFLRGM